MKVKGYELIKMIAERKIMERTIVKSQNYNIKYIFCGDTLWEYDTYYGRTNDEMCASELIANDFEILEDKTERIKNIQVDKNGFIKTETGTWKGRKLDIAFTNKLNELSEIVNKLNKQNTDKDINCMTD